MRWIQKGLVFRLKGRSKAKLHNGTVIKDALSYFYPLGGFFMFHRILLAVHWHTSLSIKPLKAGTIHFSIAVLHVSDCIYMGKNIHKRNGDKALLKIDMSDTALRHS